MKKHSKYAIENQKIGIIGHVIRKPMPQSTLFNTTSEITSANRSDHWLARAGINRSLHRVSPGLYALGNPSRDADVFVTANYTLSFDALRSALRGLKAWILVLDTQGVNVWCAAGKGSFGTAELVRRIRDSQLEKYVDHRKLILPQLGATGVSAHRVKAECGFEVEYGPVRAEDLPEYLKTHQATAEMRKVRFNLKDRLVLAPVEMVISLLPMLGVAVVIYLVGGWFYMLWWLAAWLAATLLFLILLPWLPTREFSTKGFLLFFCHATPPSGGGNQRKLRHHTAGHLAAFHAAHGFLALHAAILALGHKPAFAPDSAQDATLHHFLAKAAQQRILTFIGS